MPGHKAHDTIGIAASIPVAITTYYYTGDTVSTAIVATGVILSTLFLSPDLDLHSRIYMRWGLLRWIWIPYQRLIPHRSWVSHSGPISATLRCIYLCGWLVPALPYVNPVLLFWLWIAAMIADTIHVLADVVWSTIT